ncbi:MAG: response regulator transcription factor [Planctomycetaceae bacterium]
MPATPVRPIRVMLVDDHPVLRLGLASVLSTGHGFSIVAEAEDGPTALDRYRSLRPDVVLLDVSMERMDGIDTLRRLLGEFPAARVIMLTSSKAPQDEALALAAGAMGYLVKTVHHAAIAAAIRTVHAGGRLGASLGDPSLPATGPLSHREQEVLGLVRQGFSNDEIAALLGISERTARAHVSAILAALGAADRAQAVAMGFELGILKPSVRPGG